MHSKNRYDIWQRGVFWHAIYTHEYFLTALKRLLYCISRIPERILYTDAPKRIFEIIFVTNCDYFRKLKWGSFVDTLILLVFQTKHLQRPRYKGHITYVCFARNLVQFKIFCESGLFRPSLIIIYGLISNAQIPLSKQSNYDSNGNGNVLPIPHSN